jgi:hypothetical protein
MYGTKPFTRSEINATKAPLTTDGDSREIWVGDRKIVITRTSATEYRIVVLTVWGTLVAGYTRTEATETAARKIAQGYFLEHTGYEAPFVIEDATGQDQPFATVDEVVAEAEQIARDAAPSTTDAEALKAAHTGIRVRVDRLTAPQRTALAHAVNGTVHRGARASIRTLQALAKSGWGQLVHGDWSGTGRTNEITGLRLA